MGKTGSTGQAGANGLELAEQIVKVMDEMSVDFPDDLEYKVSLDTTLAITEGINEIVVTLFQAMVLAIGIVVDDAISVAISSINALTLSPALSAMLLRPRSEQKKSWLQPFYDWFNRSFARVTGAG